SAPPSRRAKPLALTIGKLDQRLVIAGHDQRRVVELVSAQSRASSSDWAVGEKRRLAVAEMRLVLGEARGMAKEAGHGMADAVGVLKPLAQHHVASALAVHRPRRGKAVEPFTEFVSSSEPAGMELRVPSGQPAGIATPRRGLIREWRERHDLGACAAPALKD